MNNVNFPCFYIAATGFRHIGFCTVLNTECFCVSWKVFLLFKTFARSYSCWYKFFIPTLYHIINT